jgi:hypothetical protein
MVDQRRFKVRMLEYCKNILHKLSFSRSLFRKEYKKSFQYLNIEEQQELKQWLRNNIK